MSTNNVIIMTYCAMASQISIKFKLCTIGVNNKIIIMDIP